MFGPSELLSIEKIEMGLSVNLIPLLVWHLSAKKDLSALICRCRTRELCIFKGKVIWVEKFTNGLLKNFSLDQITENYQK